METTTEEPRGLAALRANVTEVWKNRNVRRLQMAFFGQEISEWAYAMAVLVWAYDAGGAALVGGWAGARALLAVVTGPLGGAVADRLPRRTFMIANNGLRLALSLITGFAILLDLGLWAVLIPATLSTMIGASFRSAQSGLLPTLVDNPRQLTSANATSEIFESTTAFLGPALAGVLIAAFGFAPVVFILSIGMLWSMLLVAGIRIAPTEQPAPQTDADDLAEATEEAAESLWKEITGGFRLVGKDRDLMAMSGLLIVNGVMAGALMVLVVVFAAESLGNPAAVGWINAVLGVGAVIGGMVVLSIAGRAKMGRLMVYGALGWCIPLIILGFAPDVLVVVIVVFFLAGLTDPMLNVGFGVIPARIVPEALLSRAFAAIEATFVGACAIGAWATPLLIKQLGISGSVIALGVAGTVAALVCGIRMPHLDARLTVPAGLKLLEQVTLFQPLGPTMREQVAHKLEPVSASAGQVIVREGDPSDLFYLIESGTVEVSANGELLRTETTGDVFGEIGLLHEAPRTATVTAVDDVALLTLTKADFLALMAGEDRIQGLFHELATKRLAH